MGLVVRSLPERVPGLPEGAVTLGRRVAFLGIDGNDGTGQPGRRLSAAFPGHLPELH